MVEPTLDNSDQTARVRYRRRSYLTIARRALRRRVSPVGLLATKYPYRLPDRPRPSSVSLELTDACNLKCGYCINPLFANPRTYMTDEVFEALVAGLEALRADRIRVGGGEATLHRSFAPWSQRLAAQTKFLSIVTNAQWRTPAPIVRGLVDHYDLIEVSVDAGGAEQYQRARAGASYERLERNLAELIRERDRAGSEALVNIRLMLRPSTAASKDREMARWGRLADSVMPQFVIEQRHDGVPVDVYLPTQVVDRSIPRCTLPFKDLFVRSNGDVPICQVNGTELEPEDRIVLGNVRTDSLSDLWTGGRLREMRAAHRGRAGADLSTIEVCRGCSGR